MAVDVRTVCPPLQVYDMPTSVRFYPGRQEIEKELKHELTLVTWRNTMSIIALDARNPLISRSEEVLSTHTGVKEFF